MTLITPQVSNPTPNMVQAGQGEPVVLLHGVGMQSAAWGPQITALSKTHHVIAVDMPGHGKSVALATGAELADYVAWAATFIADLNLGPVNVVGHSMGALIAGGLAVEHPALIQRAALLNGVYRRTDAARQAVQARAAQIGQRAFDLETPLARWFGDMPIEQQARASVADWLGQVDLQGYATAYTAFAHGDALYADRLDQVSCPFLAMTGDGDPNSTPDMSDAMAAAVQNGRSVTIKGHRHMINLTAAEQVNQHLSDWLNTPTSGG